MTDQTDSPARSTRLDIDRLLADTSIQVILCCGSGGVGKTTTSAALALRAAEQGRKVVVLTIDPARRLAQSLGVEHLDNTPQAVTRIEAANGGSLDAMMLDMKRTFDDVVSSHATPENAQQILQNQFYQALSTSFSGTQEYMAMERVGQLRKQAEETGRWDLIIVDTPPSRSALDFLDAPEHLSSLLDGKVLRLLLTPTRGPMRLMGFGVKMMTDVMNKVLGSQLLTDVQTFVTAFEALFGGFRERANKTLQAFSSAQTQFVVVSAPERDSLREANYFIDRLLDTKMPLAGTVINRVHGSRLDLSISRTQVLIDELDPETQRVERLTLGRHLNRMTIIEREQRMIASFADRLPQVPLQQVPALATDVTDLTSLRLVGTLLAAQQ
ncbi:ArsA family ATPase [Granulicoccus phenolivorans]|uniref:ArsA family ATPase n=1 Tax=Granulicoccus phenolivorans TaxID=266854 RepID=UPI0004261F6E|nr:ArsA family ATPase [Granulicoccus phenolivorans]